MPKPKTIQAMKAARSGKLVKVGPPDDLLAKLHDEFRARLDRRGRHV